MVVVAIAGAPDWEAYIRDVLRGYDAIAARYDDRTGYIARLADDGAALILVDGNHADWRFWTTTPKISPATRRIPVVLVSRDPAQRDEALLGGANLVIAPGGLGDALPTLMTELARVPDPARMTELDRQCGEPLPPEAVEAVRKFNAGEYYRQHDLFEALWMQETGPVRELYRGVLQVGIAYFQITRGNRRGALKMLLRSVQWLAPLPDVCQGIDVATLRRDSARVRAELERLGEAGIDQFDRRLLQPVRLVE